MCPDDLRAFLNLLVQADQLARISVDVEPELELAAIVDKVSKGAAGSRALLFENVRGSSLPVVANLFGCLERVGWALGTTDLTDTAERLANDLHATGAANPSAALVALTQDPHWQPVTTARPVCREVDHSATGFKLLPAIRAWPGDGGAFLTLAQVFTRHPETGMRNCGLYRVQPYEHRAATVRCRSGSGARQHLEAWHERGMAMPVAIALGGPPALSWAAAAPLPDDVEEPAFCGYLTGQRLLMSPCQTCDLQVPASAEIVVEGTIAPDDLHCEGPFGNHTGSYDAAGAAPVMRVQNVHARYDAIYPWTLVGPPPMENIQLARATAHLLLPLVRMTLPTVRGLFMPDEGIFHRVALLTVDPTEDRPFREIAQLLWSTSLLRGARMLVVGGADHDPRDLSAVFWRVLNRVDWQRDILLEDGRLAIDARRMPPAGPVQCDPAVTQRVLARWREYGLTD